MSKVRPRPENGQLYFDFFYKGIRCREQTTLLDTVKNRADMQRVLDKIEGEIKKGTLVYRRYFPNSRLAARFEPQAESPSPNAIVVAASRQPVIAAPTFAEFVPIWVREMEPNWRANTRDWMGAILDTHLLPKFGSQILSQIKREDLLGFRADLSGRKTKAGRPISGKTVNTVMRVLRAILTEAASRYGFTAPGTFKRLKVPRKDIFPFTLEEVMLILDKVRPDFRSYFTVAFFTGMRPGEENGLKWEYVDFDRRLIYVRETYTKGKTEYTKTDGSQRDIAMNQLVYDALKAQERISKKIGPYVFCMRGGEPVHDRNFDQRVWHPLLRHLGLKRRVPYQTRHTCATLWLGAGENPQWIANQLGHTTTEMLFRVYARFIPNLTRRDGSAFDQLLQAKGLIAVADLAAP